MGMVIVLAMTLVMATMITPIATVTITMAIPTEITIVAGLAIVAHMVIGTVIVTRMEIVDHGVEAGARDDLRTSEVTSSISFGRGFNSCYLHGFQLLKTTFLSEDHIRYWASSFVGVDPVKKSVVSV